MKTTILCLISMILYAKPIKNIPRNVLAPEITKWVTFIHGNEKMNILVLNAYPQSDSSWFLTRDGNIEKKIKTPEFIMSGMGQLLASPNGKWLAITSGAAGETARKFG